jgi:hypothetical protein
MLVSQARLEANRRNAQKSTGPKTPEGKARSRANSIKHGLCSSVVVSEDLALIQRRSDEYFDSLKPQNEYHCWLVDKIAVHSIRVDRVERMERRLRDKESLRAELSWDDDRRLEVEILGGMLARKPAETVESLRQTRHGCEWLLARWALLAHAADINLNNEWTEEQAAMAFDLMATPSAFRIGRKPGTSLDFDGNVLDKAEDSAVVARRMIAELKERREVVGDIDDVERALVEADLSTRVTPELRLLRRYESSLHSRLRWFLSQLHSKNVHEKGFPTMRESWRDGSEPDPAPEPKTIEEKLFEKHPPDHPGVPFDLTPDEFPEPGKSADIPAIIQSRKEKRLAKAKSRREAERRKLEKIRNGSA